MNALSLYPEESIVFALRSLYEKHGYSHYKMNKFEEYDLYARNKDFLFSDGVITFTDNGGKLMALKPDVTLSIVKNTRDRNDTVQKVCYNENVYRISRGTQSFKETMQVGLEAIGDIDRYSIYEVLHLAAESLVCTGKNCILEISHLGILSDVMKHIGIPSDETDEIMEYIARKSIHELSEKCASIGISKDKAEMLEKLVSFYGTPDEILPKLRELLTDIPDRWNIAQFEEIISVLRTDRNSGLFRIDFSVVSNTRYYNGFVFRGFAENIPNSVLSGGQYDKLMASMKRRSRAIGFAVYLDMLELYSHSRAEYDVDTLLIYSDDVDISAVAAAVERLENSGESVLAVKTVPQGIKYRNLVNIGEGR